jgi:hypothetical protein
MTNATATTQISRRNVPATAADRHDAERLIDAVFASFDDLPVSAVYAYRAKEVAIHAARAAMARKASAERARLESDNAAMHAQIDGVFASSI